MNCPSCGINVDQTNNFCSSCGKRLSKDIPKSDFEIGKIAALDTIKSDILKWFFGLVAVAGLLGFVGVREYVKTAVDTAVKSQLDALSNRIEKASNDAEESTAEANLETKQLNSTIESLNNKTSDLSKSINAVDAQKGRLLTATQQLDERKRQMLKATDDLEQKRQQLAKIIESENLTTLFAKMRSDFYRIHTLEARAEFVFTPDVQKLPRELFSFAQMTFLGGSPQQSVMEFRILNDTSPTVMYRGEPGTSQPASAIYNYALFEPFHRSLDGKPMRLLNGINLLKVDWRARLDGEDPSGKTQAFREFFTSLSEVRVEILLNSVLIETHRLTKNDLAPPSDWAALFQNGLVLYDLKQDETGAYKDIEALYSQAISGDSQ